MVFSLFLATACDDNDGPNDGPIEPVTEVRAESFIGSVNVYFKAPQNENYYYTLILFFPFFTYITRVICRTIIYNNNFQMRIYLVDYRAYTSIQIFFPIINRYNHTYSFRNHSYIFLSKEL